jgi:hypothetical protein
MTTLNNFISGYAKSRPEGSSKRRCKETSILRENKYLKDYMDSLGGIFKDYLIGVFEEERG